MKNKMFKVIGAFIFCSLLFSNVSIAQNGNGNGNGNNNNRISVKQDLVFPVEFCGQILLFQGTFHTVVEGEDTAIHLNGKGDCINCGDDEYSFNIQFNNHNTLNNNGNGGPGGTFCQNVSIKVIGKGQLPNSIVHTVICLKKSDPNCEIGCLYEVVSVDVENVDCEDE